MALTPLNDGHAYEWLRYPADGPVVGIIWHHPNPNGQPCKTTVTWDGPGTALHALTSENPLTIDGTGLGEPRDVEKIVVNAVAQGTPEQKIREAIATWEAPPKDPASLHCMCGTKGSIRDGQFVRPGYTATEILAIPGPPATDA